MKKKQMLATLVMLSLLQGNVYAADYDDQSNVPGENIKFDQMIVDKGSPDKITIGNENTQTITIGKEDLGIKYALQINDATLANPQSPHKVTFNSKNVNIIGGRGVNIGGKYEDEYASLNVNADNFTIKADYNNYEYGGLNVYGHGGLFVGSKNKYLEKFEIIGGAGLSVGGLNATTDSARAEIYAKEVILDASGNYRYGTAFSNYANTVMEANSITLKGSGTFSSKDSVMEIHGGSDTDLKAGQIKIEVVPVEDKINEYYFAIFTKNGGGPASNQNYNLNLNADSLLEIQGNVLLNSNGVAQFSGKTVKIDGKNLGKEYDEGILNGSAVGVNSNAILKIGDYDGTDENITDNVYITSQGAYGVLVGKSGNYDSKGELLSKVNQHFSVIAYNGIGFAINRDDSKADLNTGSLYISGKTDGVKVNAGTMSVKGSDILQIEGKEGYGIDGAGSSSTSSILYETTGGNDEGIGIFISSKDDGLHTTQNFNTKLSAVGGKFVLNSDSESGIHVQSSKRYQGEIPKLNLTEISSDKGIDVIGATYAIEAYDNASVNLTASNNGTITLVSEDLDATKDSETSTVYVEGDGTYNPTVDLTAENGVVNILSNNKSVVASGKGGTVNINGAVNINTHYTGDNTGINLMSEDEQHVAIAAGGDRELLDSCGYGEINVNLTGSENSQIIGDIVGARDGIVNITNKDYTGALTIVGDILAGNNTTNKKDENGNKVVTGTVNVDLGKNGSFTGRVDDYQDAGLKNKVPFFDPHFSNDTVNKNGYVNLKMGSGSKWQVTGQSWVTTLDGNDSTIILNGEESGGYAVHIGKLTGNNTFVVNLNPDKSEFAEGDMIYVQDGTYSGLQTLKVANEEELLKNKDWDRIRFATVANAAGSAGDSNFEYGGSFGDTYTIKGRGIRNVDYAIEYVAMDEDTTSAEDNLAYNGGTDLTEAKPGADYTDKNYNKTDEEQNSQYVYLARSNGTDDGTGDYTDSAKSIINMSRANYKNAVYMDRLNKRMGEARYINGEEEEGMWVRIRHDRIGMDGEFRSQNTMYEMGYDEKQDCDNGERRVGFAIDYMDGSTTYSDIMGKGETKRYGLWLYDTWLGDKGHYADYVAKWGHLSNDFDIHDKDSLEHVIGDYSNNVFSVSAEYGRKKDIGNDWYIEPQAQLQLARVTGAEYTTTTQDTKVSVDGINSLIGRAGFRLGRDVDERSTVYIKADLLHEFLGDQTITATDATGSLRETFENKGTWYDIGFGFATALGKDSYAFMDFEKSFGNDNDETYQINAGVQWTF